MSSSLQSVVDVMIVFLDADQVHLLVDALEKNPLKSPAPTFFASQDSLRDYTTTLKKLFPTLYVLDRAAPTSGLIEELKTSLLKVITLRDGNKTELVKLLDEYAMKKLGCTLHSNLITKATDSVCTMDQETLLENSLMSDSYGKQILLALQGLEETLKRTINELCKEEDVARCPLDDIRTSVLRRLTAQDKRHGGRSLWRQRKPHAFELLQFSKLTDDQEIKRKKEMPQQIFMLDSGEGSGTYEQLPSAVVSNRVVGATLRMGDANLTHADEEGTTYLLPLRENSDPKLHRRSKELLLITKKTLEERRNTHHGSHKGNVTPTDIMSRPWVVAVIVLAVAGILITIFVFVYMFVRMCSEPQLMKFHSISLILLFAIGCLYANIILFILPNSDTICSWRLFLHPLAYTLCFGALIVKLMFLRAEDQIGLGGRTPISNIYLTLLFILSVQIVICTQWFQLKDGWPENVDCFYEKSDFIMLHIYDAVLLVLALVMSVMLYRTSRNYLEVRWVFLSVLFNVPIFASWSIVYFLAPTTYHDPVICIAILSSATVTLVLIFIPTVGLLSKQSDAFRHVRLQPAQASSSGSNTVVTNMSDLDTVYGSCARVSTAHVSHNPVYDDLWYANDPKPTLVHKTKILDPMQKAQFCHGRPLVHQSSSASKRSVKSFEVAFEQEMKDPLFLGRRYKDVYSKGVYKEAYP
ncbi:unnamed protein product [Darwinula stevensoni]|uniref:G-protein coupled receptors family 3 profile domain-containing protein n=1 Tax=Darwinula stevensoni TaxID=69355 RepID=A0A7R9FQ83_9CRUS|nr:unnamed protein product [Darwinula stevensoni]CAG0899287.1 unnamed protein product [Darwinula stevensoni]